MTRKLALVLALALSPLALGSPVMALDADELFADPRQEARAREIGRQLRCLKCRNQSIFDSNAGIAKDLRVVVRERIVAGDSDAQILAFVADRFGDYVLLKPRLAGQTYVLWLSPLLFLGIGGVAIWAFHRAGRRRAEAAPLDDADLAAAQRILDGEPS